MPMALDGHADDVRSTITLWAKKWLFAVSDGPVDGNRRLNWL